MVMILFLYTSIVLKFFSGEREILPTFIMQIEENLSIIEKNKSKAKYFNNKCNSRHDSVLPP